MRIIYLVRHAKSEGNLVIHSCHSAGLDYPPSFRNHCDRETRLLMPDAMPAIEAARPQIEDLLKKGMQVFCSDYVRTQETLKHLLVNVNPKQNFRVDPLLNERHWGIYEKLDVQHKEALQKTKSRDPFGLIFPQGESLNQVRSRFTQFYQKHVNENRVLCITHQEFIIAAISEFLELSTEQFKGLDLYKLTPNCSTAELIDRGFYREVRIYDGGELVQILEGKNHQIDSYEQYPNMADKYREELVELNERKHGKVYKAS